MLAYSRILPYTRIHVWHPGPPNSRAAPPTPNLRRAPGLVSRAPLDPDLEGVLRGQRRYADRRAGDAPRGRRAHPVPRPAGAPETRPVAAAASACLAAPVRPPSVQEPARVARARPGRQVRPRLADARGAADRPDRPVAVLDPVAPRRPRRAGGRSDAGAHAALDVVDARQPPAAQRFPTAPPARAAPESPQITQTQAAPARAHRLLARAVWHAPRSPRRKLGPGPTVQKTILKRRAVNPCRFRYA